MIGRGNHGLALFPVLVLVGGSDRSGSVRMDDDDCHTNPMDDFYSRFFIPSMIIIIIPIMMVTTVVMMLMLMMILSTRR